MGGSGASQHWHHLTPEQQRIYDESNDSGRIKGLGGIQKLIHLEEHSLSLPDLLGTYEGLFASSDLISSPPLILPPDWYARQVLHRWSEFLTDRRHLGLRPTKSIESVAGILERGAQEGWRRRQFFTQLERVESTGPRSPAVRALMNQTKILAVNAAFYDEFEHYIVEDRPSVGRIIAVRDLSPIWQIDRTSSVVDSDRRQPLLSAAISPLELLRLEDIVSFHRDPTYKPFQHSINELHALSMRQRCQITEDEIRKAVAGHIEIINECAKTAFARRGLKSPTEGSVAEVFLGVHPAIASAAVAALMFAAGIPTAIIVSLNVLFVVVLRRKTRSDEWRQLELELKEQIHDELVGEEGR